MKILSEKPLTQPPVKQVVRDFIVTPQFMAMLHWGDYLAAEIKRERAKYLWSEITSQTSYRNIETDNVHIRYRLNVVEKEDGEERPC